MKYNCGGPFGTLESIAIAPTGKIILAGQTDATDWTLAALYGNGTGDTNFGSGGSNTVDIPLAGTAAQFLAEPNGKLLVAGVTINADIADAYFARYTNGGLGAVIDAVAPSGLTASINETSYSEGDGTAEIDGSFTAAGTADADTLTVDWGDVVNGAEDNETQTLSPGQTTFELPEHDYATSNTYSINISVSNPGGTDSLASPIVVSYATVGPSALNLSLDSATITAGGQSTLGGSFADSFTDGTPVVTIDWGDGGDTPDATTLTLDQGNTSFSADPHTYTTAGKYTIHVTVTDGDESTSSTATVTVYPTIPDVWIYADAPTTTETGPSPGDFVLFRDGDTTNPLTVYYTVDAASTAESGVDYEAISGEATFAADSNTANISISPLDTGKQGGSVTVQVDLTTSEDYAVVSGLNSSSVTIYGQDLPTVSIVRYFDATESGTAGSFQVTRIGPTDQPLLVTYLPYADPSGHTAQGGVDYDLLCDDVIIPAGYSSAAIDIGPIDTGRSGGVDSIPIKLTDSDAYNISLAMSTATITLTYDDPPTVTLLTDNPFCSSEGSASFTVKRNGGLGTSLDVYYTIGGSAAHSVTIPIGANSAGINVPLPDDLDPGDSEPIALVSGSIGFRAEIGASTGTITAVSEATYMESIFATVPVITEMGGIPGSASVVLSQAPGQDITVAVGLGGSAVYGTDYTISSPDATACTVYDGAVYLTFAAGSAERTVDVAPMVDAAATGNNDVTLTPLGGDGYGWCGSDEGESGSYGPVEGDGSQGKVTINDDLPQATIDDTSVVEGDTATFDVKLSKPVSYDVTFDYETEDGTAIDGTDYSGQSGEITIPAGATDSTDIAIPTLYDPNNTSSLKYSVNLSASSGVEVVKNEGSGIITAGTPNQSLPKLSISNVTVDAGDNAVFTATLSASVSYPVSFHYETRDGSAKSPTDYDATQGTIVFSPGETTETISVPTEFDDDNIRSSLIFELYADQLKGAVAPNAYTGTYGTSTYAFGTIVEFTYDSWWAQSGGPWSFNPSAFTGAIPTNKGKYTAQVTAHGAPTLQNLAELITGNAADWTELLTTYTGTYNTVTTAVPDRTVIDVSPLLVLLENRMRDAVVNATSALKFTTFAGQGQPHVPTTNAVFTSAEINAYFNQQAASGLAMECHGAAQLIIAKGLMDVIGQTDYDALYSKTVVPTLAATWTTSVTNLNGQVTNYPLVKKGDWGYIKNVAFYFLAHPGGAWGGENVICTGYGASGEPTDAIYWGFGAGKGSYAQMCDTLLAKYNQDVGNGDKKTLSDLVGWVPAEEKFINVAQVASEVFDENSKKEDVGAS